jgi:REP element-mobilizing transposase RayT
VFANVELDAFVVMPNHIQGVIWIKEDGAYRIHPGTWKREDTGRGGQLPAPTEDSKYETLSNIIGAFKTTAATRLNKLRGCLGFPVWQKSFYDRVIRNEHELEQTRKYIQNNPFQWEADRNNPARSRFSNPKSIDDYWNEMFE